MSKLQLLGVLLVLCLSGCGSDDTTTGANISSSESAARTVQKEAEKIASDSEEAARLQEEANSSY